MFSKGFIRTDFLYARPSFGSGAARVLDLCGLFDSYNGSSSEADADERAIATDWLVVGKDMNEVFEEQSQALGK